MCNTFQQIACLSLSPVFLNNFTSCSAPHQQYNLQYQAKSLKTDMLIAKT